MAESYSVGGLTRRLWDALTGRRPSRPTLSAPERCGAVGSLYDLVERYPALRKVIRHYSSSQYVPVFVNTCSLPQATDGSLREDCVVFGLFYVDRGEATNPLSIRVIRQDYFVVWTDGSGQMLYYSGGPSSWKFSGPIHWRDIDAFCLSDHFAGLGQCYGCEPRPRASDPVRPKHWYSEHDPDLALEPVSVWRPAFDLALAVARARI